MNLWKTNKAIFDKTPYPKWKRLALPEDLFFGFEKGVKPIIESKDSGVKIQNIETFFRDDWTEDHAFAPLFEMEYLSKHTLGDKFSSYINHLYNSGYVIRASHKGFEPAIVHINYDFGDEQRTQIENNIIIVEAGSKLDVVLDYHGEKARHYGTTRVIAKAGSEVRVFKLQRLEGTSEFYDQNFCQVHEGAKMTWFDLELGAAIKAVTYETELQGRHAASDLNSIYYGEEKNQIDIAYTMKHFGEKTESSILSKGALDQHAKKTFRGNLEFNKGAKQSVGKEQEFVVLLSETVKSDSIPALMCGEDDVIGAHAASVGQVDLDKLFYMMSRGFSEKEAKKLIIKGSFEEIINAIPFEGIRNQVAYEMDRRV